jgi:hypothetical protein
MESLLALVVGNFLEYESSKDFCTTEGSGCVRIDQELPVVLKAPKSAY